jgi:DinB superfamily
VPIPAVADGPGAASVVLALLRQLHDELRDVVAELGVDALNWVPTQGANSISTIVVHVVGSEAETLRSVAGLPCERDRDAEFAEGALTKGDLLQRLSEADELIAAVETRVDARRLRATVALPTLPASEGRTGLTWLVGTYGHAREHLGHIQLTAQLYERERASGA